MKLKTFNITFIFLLSQLFSPTLRSELKKEIRVKLSYRLPIDPLELRSMADYDLSLSVAETWFKYDDSRKAIPNLILCQAKKLPFTMILRKQLSAIFIPAFSGLQPKWPSQGSVGILQGRPTTPTTLVCCKRLDKDTV